MSRNPVPRILAINASAAGEESVSRLLVRGEPATPAELATGRLSDTLIEELRAGETFRYTSTGPEGLLDGQRVIVMGITNVEFIRVEKTGFGSETRAAAIAQARARIETLVQPDLERAA